VCVWDWGNFMTDLQFVSFSLRSLQSQSAAGF
jgi:hypothetical protein